jgi:pyrroline-5-carboxylate reductase
MISGTLVLLGAGKMGGALLEGWLRSGVDPARIVALDPAPPEEVAGLIARHGVRHNPDLGAIGAAEVVIVAVKPQIMDEVLPGVVGLSSSRPLVLSVVAGKTIASLERHFGAEAAVIRTIPNTPAAVGRGITTMVANPHVSPSQLKLARGLLSAVGEVVEVDDETLIDAATAVAGSGPAYVFYLAECLAKAGMMAGLPHDVATQLARETVAGAGELMRVTGLPADQLRRNVTSPKGTTHAALEVLMRENGVEPLMIEAVAAATRRARELAS